MKKGFFSFVMLMFFVVTSSFAIEPQWVIDLHEAHTNAGMKYRLLRPLNFDPGRLYPVIVSLHSYPGVADDNIRNIRQWNTQLSDPQLRADYPAYVVVPQTSNTWERTHLQRVQDVISNELVNVDMGRIYVLGQSYGGYGTWKFINWTGPGYFAAAAPVSGSGQPTTAANVKDIPIWAFHGTTDTTVKYSLDWDFFTNSMVGVGNEKLTAFVGVGHSTDDKFIYYAGDPGADHGVTYFSDATNIVKVCDPEPVFMKWLFSKRLPGWYPLTVNSGNGSGSYTNGRQVAISAKAVSGMTFVQWTGDTQVVNNVTYTNALVTMSTNAVTLTATYTNLPGWYTLSVLGGTGGGVYTNETQVLISASNAPAGQAFDRWTGDTQFVGSVTSATTTATLSGQDVSLTATYKNVYTLTVNNGTGSGTYDGGQQVEISANPGRTFVAWIGDTQHVSSATASPATVTMPATNITLTATYTDVILTVIDGTGSGSYTNGQTVTISRSDVRAGVSLSAWIGTGAPYVTSSTTVVMPPQDITLTATYNYALTVNSGTGSGAYANGQEVEIVASNAPSGKTFDRWIGDTQYVNDVTFPDTTVIMSTNPVTLTATYVDYVSATIAVVDSTGGETSSTSTNISKMFPVTGGNVLVVNLSYKGVNNTYPAGPLTLDWVTGGGAVTQTMTRAVQAGNGTAAKAFGSSIYYLRNPVADAGGTISGSLPTGYVAQIISAFTLSGVDTTALPISSSNINDATTSSSITTPTVAGVPAGGFAALCSGSAATNSGTGFSASASGGTPVSWLTNNVGGGYWYQGYISNLVTTTTNFRCAHGSAARLHIVAAVFSPGNLATIIPALQAPTATGITATNATLGATVIPNGGSTIDDYGIVYAATAVNSAPEVGGPGAIKLQKGTNQTMGAFTVSAAGLTPGVQYSYAGYAHNSAGYGYSSYGTFTAPYMLTVNNGSGSGSYTNGAVVAITAAAPATGKIFDHWTGDTAYLANSNSASTTLTMPAQAVSLTATYVDVYYTLTIINGTGSGSFTNGQQVTISAAFVPPPGTEFVWTGDTGVLVSNTSPTTFIMPAANITLTANYRYLQYTLTVNSGTGGGSYINGQQVAISADTPAEGQLFDHWIGDTAYLADSNSANTTVTMPAQAVSLTATYKNAAVYYTLTADTGAGGTVSPASTNVLSGGSADFVVTASNYCRIAALTTNGMAVTGMTFDNNSTTTNFIWSNVQNSGVLAATFTNVLYTLTVNSGTGGGSYANGQQVAITADAPAAGKAFDKWIGDTQYLAGATVTMPATNITLTATYQDITYTLTGQGSAGGSVSPASTNVLFGGSATFTITASNYYRIASLTTNGTGVGIIFTDSSTSYTYIWSNVQYSGTLAATFSPQIEIPPVDPNLDSDGDGVKDWQEYIAGTNPTNAASVFKAAQNTRNVITWSPATGRVYSVYWTTNLVNGFQPLETNILYPQSSYTNLNPGPRVNLYQIKVRMQ